MCGQSLILTWGIVARVMSVLKKKAQGRSDWLVSLAAVHFKAVFMQTPSRNGIEHERFRYEIHNTTTLQQFRQAIGVYLREGAWT